MKGRGKEKVNWKVNVQVSPTRHMKINKKEK